MPTGPLEQRGGKVGEGSQEEAGTAGMIASTVLWGCFSDLPPAPLLHALFDPS